MPKLKTHKATAKRLHVTKRKKLLHRASGQDHFNAREAGKITTRKRRDRRVPATDGRNLRERLPYS